MHFWRCDVLFYSYVVYCQFGSITLAFLPEYHPRGLEHMRTDIYLCREHTQEWHMSRVMYVGMLNTTLTIDKQNNHNS